LTLKKLGFEKQSKKINGIKKLVYNLEMIL
jgi:hypothetical protein